MHMLFSAAFHSSHVRPLILDGLSHVRRNHLELKEVSKPIRHLQIQQGGNEPTAELQPRW